MLRSDSLSNCTSPCEIMCCPTYFLANSSTFSIKGVHSRKDLLVRVDLVEFSSMIARSISNWLEALINILSLRFSTSDVELILYFTNASFCFLHLSFIFSFLKDLNSSFLSGLELKNLSWSTE